MAKVASKTGVTCELNAVIKTIRHGVTRFRITLDCYRATYRSGRVRAINGGAVRWIPLAELPALPLSTTGRRIADLIERGSGVGLLRKK